MKSLVCVLAVALAVSASAEDLPIDLSKMFDGSSSVKFTSDGGGFSDFTKGYEGDPQVVLKELKIYPALSTNVPNSALFDRFGAQDKSKGYFVATYLVLAKNLVEIDTENLEIESITDATGKDYSKRKSGAPAWEADGGLGFHTQISRDQGFGIFQLKGAGKVWAKSVPTVKGKVKISVADKMATKEFSGKISSGRIGEGDFSWKVKLASGFMSDDKMLQLSPVGAKSDGEITVMADGKELQTFGYVETNGKTSYTYKKPAGDDITIKITYPDGAREITLPL